MTSSTSSGALPFGVRVAVLDVALGRDAAQAVRSASVAPLGGVQHAAHEQQCAGRRVLDGPGEGPVEDRGGSGFGRQARPRARSRRSSRRRACRPRRRRRGRAAGCGRAPCRPGRRSARRGRAPARTRGRGRASISGSASSSELVGAEARQLDGAASPSRHARVVPRRRASPRSRRSLLAVRAAGPRPRRARSVPSTRIIVTSPAPSNGAGRVPSNGCVHFAVEVLGVGERRTISSSSKPSRMRGIIPRVFSFDHALIAVEVERAGVERQRRPGRVARAEPRGLGGQDARRPRAASSMPRRAPRGSRPVAPARIDAQRPREPVGREDDVAVEALQQREPESMRSTDCRAAPARARWPRTGP